MSDPSKKVAVVAGTGFETAFGDTHKSIDVPTPYGDVQLFIYSRQGGELIVVPRHGAEHAIAPHKVNNHAQIWALKDLGVQSVLATSAVGSLRLDRCPGDLIVIDDFIDYRGAVTTYYDGGDTGVRHADFSTPFSKKLRQLLIQSIIIENEEENRPVALYQQGTYLCVSGPRYETPAEVRLFGSWGADVVGMTIAPEAILAREIGLEYGVVSVVTNYGTGLSNTPLDHSDVSHQMKNRSSFLVKVLNRTAEMLFAAIQPN